GKLLRARSLGRLEAGEFGPPLLKLAAAGEQGATRLLELTAQPGAALGLGAEGGGAAADLGEGRREQGTNVDGVLHRARLDQGQRRRAARHGLKRRGQP